MKWMKTWGRLWLWYGGLYVHNVFYPKLKKMETRNEVHLCGLNWRA